MSTQEQAALDDLLNFDEEETALVPIKTPAEIEAEQTEKIRLYRRWKNIILSPEAARFLAEGHDEQELADVLGCQLETVKKYVHTADMTVLLEKESRRLINHLSGRKLDGEKYRDLVISAGVLIDKARQIRDEPEDESHKDTPAEILDRVAYILWGPEGRGRESDRIIDISAEPQHDGIPELHAGDEEGGPEEHRGNPESSAEHLFKP